MNARTQASTHTHSLSRCWNERERKKPIDFSHIAGMLLFKPNDNHKNEYWSIFDYIKFAVISIFIVPILILSLFQSLSISHSLSSVHHSISCSLPSIFVIVIRTFIMQFLYFHQTNYSTDRHAYHPYKSHGMYIVNCCWFSPHSSSSTYCNLYASAHYSSFWVIAFRSGTLVHYIIIYTRYFYKYGPTDSSLTRTRTRTLLVHTGVVTAL